METRSKENSNQDLKKAKEFGRNQLKKLMHLKTKKINAVSKSASLNTMSMRVNIEEIRRMVLGHLGGLQATCTKATTKMMKGTATERCAGQTAQSTSALGNEEFNTV